MDQTNTTSPQSSIDHDHESTGQTNKVVGRFYECNFCKGRFTNAQALGGHMNIHRKEKAIKASRSAKVVLAKDQNHHHHQYLHLQIDNNDPNNYEYYGSTNFSSSAHDQAAVNYMGTNLSLSIGKLCHEDIQHEEIGWNQIHGNELDLELRLGYK